MNDSGNTKAIEQYAELLLQLHELIAEGKGDDPEADAIRDRMDAPWYKTDEEAQELLRGLSIDLYSLSESQPKGIPMTPEERKVWGEKVKQAFEGKDWSLVLATIRRPPIDVPPYYLDAMRAHCWEQLGCLAVSVRFKRDEFPRNPLDKASVVS